MYIFVYALYICNTYINILIYMYMCIHIYIYIYIYVYTKVESIWCGLPSGAPGALGASGVVSWSQNMVF